MRTIRVELGERSYPIMIEAGLLGLIGEELKRLGFKGRVAVVTNPVVGALYLERVLGVLKGAGFDPAVITVPDGEEHKTLEEASRVYDGLIGHRMERSSPIIALGGGVIGDLAGFVAATYLRGVPYIQVPTTLLSQVDSSVGGKTAVNLPQGKNLVGAFYQPKAVFIDPEVLKSLEPREIRAGLSEVVKYGVIWDEPFFRSLEANPEGLLRLKGGLTEAIVRSCEIKAEVVTEDERESGLRSILNFGHTFGHAIEALTGYGTFKHGEAVSMGMAMAAAFSVRLGLCDGIAERRLRALLKALGLPVERPGGIRTADFIDSMLLDKKVSGGAIRFVLIDGGIGSVVLREAPIKEIKVFLDTYR